MNELKSEERDILKLLVYNEIEYYEDKEDKLDRDIEFIKELKTILDKLEKGSD